MRLEQDAPRLKNHWLHASGGMLWHLRALRSRNTLWKPFRQTVQHWLQSWQPPTDKLLLVGPSAGYTLNAEFLERWREVVVLEPDPLARTLLQLRYKTVNLRFDMQDVLSSSKSPGVLDEQFAGYAILFVNVLGQLAPRTKADSNRWIRDLRQKLAGSYWGSYHDVMSTAREPDALSASWTAHKNVTLDDALNHYWRGGELEIVDHYCFGLGGGQCDGRAYCVWPLRSGQYHLVEWLTGAPAQA